MTTPLTPPYERLAALVAQGWTWPEAVKDAGITDVNWRVLSRREDLRSHIDALRKQKAEAVAPAPRGPITPEELRAIFEGQGTFDPVVFEDVKSLTDLREHVPEELRRLLVKGWKYDKAGNFILELCDKDAALDRLARHHGFYNDKTTIKHVGFDELLAAAERAAGAT